MAQAYTPGLQATKQTRVAKRRELPIAGEVLVNVGDRVEATTPVLSANLPGDLNIIRVANRMGLDTLDVVPGMKCKVGDSVERGDLLCEVKTFFGLFNITLESPTAGDIEFFTEANAHLGVRDPSVPLSVEAYINGIVTEIEAGKAVTIETDGALIQGIFGVGGERLGKLHALPIPHDELVTPETLQGIEEKNLILVGGSQYTIEALHTAAEKQVAGIVTGSIDAETLRSYVGYDIGVSITGDEEVPFTLIVTEGFGSLPISSRIADLIEELDGQTASINGATQVRAGAVRPEIIVPHQEVSPQGASASEPQVLKIGSRIRIIRVPYFGQLGEVTQLPSKPTKIPTGASVRVLCAKLENGKDITVPRANVELVV